MILLIAILCWFWHDNPLLKQHTFMCPILFLVLWFSWHFCILLRGRKGQLCAFLRA
jgi:hypothetical protein